MKFYKAIMFLIFFISFNLLSNEVVMIRREFAMKNSEFPLPADVYINKYYKIGEILSVERKIMIKTPSNNNKFLSMKIPFCLVKIIFSEGSHSIGRVVYMKNRDELPHIEHYSPIVGDEISKPTEYLMKGYKKSEKGILKDYSEARLNQDPKQKNEVVASGIIL